METVVLSADHETEYSDVMIVTTTPAPDCQALMEIPVSQLARDTKPVRTAPQNVFRVTPTKQAEGVNTMKWNIFFKLLHRSA